MDREAGCVVVDASMCIYLSWAVGWGSFLNRLWGFRRGDQVGWLMEMLGEEGRGGVIRFVIYYDKIKVRSAD